MYKTLYPYILTAVFCIGATTHVCRFVYQPPSHVRSHIHLKTDVDRLTKHIKISDQADDVLLMLRRGKIERLAAHYSAIGPPAIDSEDVWDLASLQVEIDRRGGCGTAKYP